MANQALIKKDDWILDPFAGTCGILIPSKILKFLKFLLFFFRNIFKCKGMYWGAVGFGGEIDSRVLHGMGVGRLNKLSPLYQEYIKNNRKADIWDNFEQYKLPRPHIVKMDIMSCELNA